MKERDPRRALKNIGSGLRIGLAEDDAFSFYYRDNLELLEYMGMEIIPFSPLEDEVLPQELDGIYLGGGFPEVHGKRLSSTILSGSPSMRPWKMDCRSLRNAEGICI